MYIEKEKLSLTSGKNKIPGCNSLRKDQIICKVELSIKGIKNSRWEAEKVDRLQKITNLAISRLESRWMFSVGLNVNTRESILFF